MDDFAPNYSLATLLKRLEHGAMRALRWCRNGFQASAASHNETLYDTIAFIVAFVLHLQTNEQDRRAFLNDEHWSEKPHTTNEKNLSRLAAMYILGAKKCRGALYNQALTYTKVADWFLEIDIEPSDIPAELKRKPIYKLLDEIDARKAKENGTNKGTTSHAPAIARESGSSSDSVSSDQGNQDLLDGKQLGIDDQDGDDEPDDADGADGGSEPPRPGGREPDTDPVEQKRTERTRPRFDAKQDIALRGAGFLTALLALRSHERLWVCVERTDKGGFDDWKELVVIAVEQYEATARQGR
ncbi:MAG: hypothetical protein EOO77_15150 [Oxalobacteraceae bacterium]|nr:MAG: hypothetical protein EOO77_15150 [Oxalobacteraceae bacterium]